MRTVISSGVVSLIMAVSPCCLLLADEGPVWEPVRELEPTSDVKQAEACVQALQAIRAQSVVRLIETACNPKLSNQVRLAAIHMLGELRAPEAVGALMGQLTVCLPVNEMLCEPTFPTLYPCTGALICIGKPSSLAAAKLLRKEDDEGRRSLLCFIIETVEGKQGGRILIEQQLHDTLPQDEIVRRRLQNALESPFLVE